MTGEYPDEEIQWFIKPEDAEGMETFKRPRIIRKNIIVDGSPSPWMMAIDNKRDDDSYYQYMHDLLKKELCTTEDLDELTVNNFIVKMWKETE